MKFKIVLNGKLLLETSDCFTRVTIELKFLVPNVLYFFFITFSVNLSSLKLKIRTDRFRTVKLVFLSKKLD